jgi:hypothetical protein
VTDQQIAQGTGPTPSTITVQGSQQLLPKLAFAAFDGTGAAGDFLPVVKFIGPAGTVAGQAVGDVVTAGASVDQTWFRGLAKQSGGGSSTDHEQLQSNASTLIAGPGFAYLDWDKLGGSDLLDLTNPKQPTVKKAGVYAITTTVYSTTLTAAARYYHQLGAGSPDFPQVVQSSGVATAADPNPYVSCSMTYFLRVNIPLFAYVFNFDAVARNFGIFRAEVQRLS